MAVFPFHSTVLCWKADRPPLGMLDDFPRPGLVLELCFLGIYLSFFD